MQVRPDLARRWVAAAVIAAATQGCASMPEAGGLDDGDGRPPPAAHDAGRANEVLLVAMNYLDVPYRRGGTAEDQGFDCSGFTRHVFAQSLGVALPRRADEQAGAAGFVRVRRAELAPGDLVFFNTLRRTFSHVGIYMGEGRFIHAPKPGAAVRVEDMRLPYWTSRFTGARRVAAAGQP
jgi:cell wall-associated NlpC family hydrolase